MEFKKHDITTFDGCAVTVAINGSVEDYALAFLAIFNNVKDSRLLYKVTNDYSNNITVYCDPDAKDSCIEFLQQFGEIKDTQTALMYQMSEDFDWDIDKYWSAEVVPYFE